MLRRFLNLTPRHKFDAMALNFMPWPGPLCHVGCLTPALWLFSSLVFAVFHPLLIIGLESPEGGPLGIPRGESMLGVHGVSRCGESTG